jgi:hypothetical protein
MTTKHEWLAKANEHKDDLRGLIKAYHPGMPSVPWSEVAGIIKPLPITASGPEAARRQVAGQIQSEAKENPVEAFDKALEAGDVGKLMKLLNQAWFGVPESTSCWGIAGFSEAVALLEDPPDDVADMPEE